MQWASLNAPSHGSGQVGEQPPGELPGRPLADPRLKQVIDANGFALTPTEPIFQWAFGVYSDNHRSVAALPQDAVIAVPSDGANQGQALWLLQREG